MLILVLLSSRSLKDRDCFGKRIRQSRKFSVLRVLLLILSQRLIQRHSQLNKRLKLFNQIARRLIRKIKKPRHRLINKQKNKAPSNHQIKNSKNQIKNQHKNKSRIKNKQPIMKIKKQLLLKKSQRLSQHRKENEL